MSRDTVHPNRIAALPRGKNHWRYTDNPTILTLHKRLRKKFGKASSHNCVDCGNKAIDWSFEGGDTYTENIDDYKPRCRSCHVKFDMTQERKDKISLGLKKAYLEKRR